MDCGQGLRGRALGLHHQVLNDKYMRRTKLWLLTGCWREFFQVIWRSSAKTLAIETIPAYDGPLLCLWPVNSSRNKGHLTFKNYSCFSHHLAKTVRLDHTMPRPGSGMVEIRRQACNCAKFHTGPWAGSNIYKGTPLWPKHPTSMKCVLQNELTYAWNDVWTWLFTEALGFHFFTLSLTFVLSFGVQIYAF